MAAKVGHIQRRVASRETLLRPHLGVDVRPAVNERLAFALGSVSRRWCGDLFARFDGLLRFN